LNPASLALVRLGQPLFVVLDTVHLLWSSQTHAERLSGRDYVWALQLPKLFLQQLPIPAKLRHQTHTVN